jgi:hypothetical protein
LRHRCGFPRWHYIDLPVLPDGPRPSTANLSMEYPAPTKLDDYNVAQATKYCLSVLAGDRAGVDAQAMAYCWVLHLVGDMHQPLHTADLVCDYFPVSDEGGNKIPVVQGKNLHSLWDNLLGRQSKMSDVAREVAKLKQQPELWQVDRIDYENRTKESDDDSHVKPPQAALAVLGSSRADYTAADSLPLCYTV